MSDKRAKLTEKQVEAIREAHKGGAKQKDLAALYRVDPSWISQIVHGWGWKK